MKKRRIVSLFLAIGLLLSLTLPASAAGIGDRDTDGNTIEQITSLESNNPATNPGSAPEQELPAATRSAIPAGPSGAPDSDVPLSAEDRQAFLERFNAIPKTAPTTRAATWYYIPTNSYRIYAQENSYFCGPAAVKTVLTYANGSAGSQSAIAQEIGTTSIGTYMRDVKPYLSDESGFSYLNYDGNTQSDMGYALYDTVVAYDMPAFISCRFSQGGPWRYSSNGHMMTLYGVTSDRSRFMLSDSWIDYAGLSGQPYTEVTASQLYSAYKEILW